MIARGFKPVAWVAAIGTAALGCYMLSLQVAAERADLAALEQRIVRTQQDIRALQTELGTRGRLSQLEQWNAEVLALSAPVAGQFLESNLSLARFDVRQRTLADRAEVRMAAAETAPTEAVRPAVRMAAAATAPAQPQLRVAAAASPAPAPAPVPAPIQPPLVRRASLQTAPAIAPGRPAAVQVRSAALLDAGTLDDLRAEARSERDGGARN